MTHTPEAMQTREAEAWEQVAQHVLQRGLGRLGGLCYRLRVAPIHHVLKMRMQERLERQVTTHLAMMKRDCTDLPGYADMGYVYPYGEDLEARILACLWMAEDARAGVPV